MDISFIDRVGGGARGIPGPMVIPWPMPGNPGALRSVANFAEWCEMVRELAVNPAVPLPERAAYERAQKLYVVGWIDADSMKAGELIAFTALELALTSRYGKDLYREREQTINGVKTKYRVPHRFANYLRYMVSKDGLTNDQLPCARKYGGTVIGFVTGESKPSLSERRNEAAHGNPFGGGWPSSGTLELIRDLIDYAYRDRIATLSDSR
jgi:hypothetical protein